MRLACEASTACNNIMTGVLEEVSRYRMKEGVKAMMLELVEEAMVTGEIRILIKDIKDQRPARTNEIEMSLKYQSVP